MNQTTALCNPNWFSSVPSVSKLKITGLSPSTSVLTAELNLLMKPVIETKMPIMVGYYGHCESGFFR